MAKAGSLDEAISRGGYTGWDRGNAQADFNSTGGPDFNDGGGGGGGGSGGGGGGFQPLSAPDLAKLREQVYTTISPYYEELAKQAKGDFDLAVKMMTTDYQQGVREQKENLALTNKYGQAAFTNALDTLGVTFGNENRQLVDNLNKRGMAVYQNNPDGTPNVVTPGTLNPTYNFNDYTYGQNIPVQQNAANTGYGGTELGRLRQDQSLRAEAEMRAKMQPLESAGLNFKQQTNPGSGFDPTKPGAYTGDRSKLGGLETGLLNKSNTAEQGYRDTTQNLANQRSQEVNNLAGQFANTGTKTLDTNLTNQLAQERQNTFIRGGV